MPRHDCEVAPCNKPYNVLIIIIIIMCDACVLHDGMYLRQGQDTVSGTCRCPLLQLQNIWVWLLVLFSSDVNNTFRKIPHILNLNLQLLYIFMDLEHLGEEYVTNDSAKDRTQALQPQTLSSNELLRREKSSVGSEWDRRRFSNGSLVLIQIKLA